MSDDFLAAWARQLGVAADPFSLSLVLVNEKHNYQTAACLLFGLSMALHKEYLIQAALELKQYVAEKPDGKIDIAGLADFQQSYVKKAGYPG